MIFFYVPHENPAWLAPLAETIEYRACSGRSGCYTRARSNSRRRGTGRSTTGLAHRPTPARVDTDQPRPGALAVLLGRELAALRSRAA